MMAVYMTVRELYEIVQDGNPMEVDGLDYVQIQGWVRTNRSNNNVGFIELNDGTYFRNCQCVYPSTLMNYADATKYLTGTALTITGKFVLTPQNKQPFEIEVKEVVLEGACDP
ncbi:MAG: OB-fold nucleic acid binding domain-containing protein, partial [Erysipelotrichaceae bacterium]|nr:OB-fold nucleic acid binding domain-containing protein [Erysipelotrichaceae bacterium]